ncbi:twin-arginine translocation signal domain-containing protein [Brucella sp. 2280]|uniref:twin-arginine translocation signal domain-containing protein n=1 Tax=Brucella sp. 2280 TaxID=2592625 RepID=UPI001294BA8A|nr:twin-arginine translocation signal domain-containing protein [Brucella sp. 2280]QGA55858.1 twin-arginine translocation signal domain-containing protein [Brucella sp. 2280]
MMKDISRRSLLQAIPAVGVAVAVPSVALAAEPEHPLVKAKRLAREISETMESIEPDDRPSCIMVFP